MDETPQPQTPADVPSIPARVRDGAVVLAFPRGSDGEKIAESPALAQEGGGENGGDGAGQGDGAPPQPRQGGGQGGNDDDGPPSGLIEMLNRNHCLVLLGSRAVIMRESAEGPIEDRVRVLSLDAFKAYFQNRVWRHKRTVTNDKGEPEEKTAYIKYAPAWLSAKGRRTYDGIEFFPDAANAAGTPGYFNVWRGFSVKPDDATPPDERWLKYKTFRDHLLTNVCSGNETHFRWVFAWFAHIVQRPRERIGTAIVLRGKMGSGKTKVGEIMGKLYASHYFLVDDPRYLVGQFNAHMASCLLLQVDEGFWAGDKAAEGRLKGLVTAPKQMIEAKGVDPIRLDNYVRLLFSSNEDWVVPAGMDERRFAVFDVANHVAQNHAYFAEMDAEMQAGGYEALLADLLALDLDADDGPNLRVIPKTDALLEQKLRSLDPITSWWFERLMDGALTRRRSKWSDEIAIETLFHDYVLAADRIGVRRKAEMTSFGMRMRRLVPDLRIVKRWTEVEHQDGTTFSKRVNCFLMPDLNACRAAFTAAVGQTVHWLPDDPDAGPPERESESESVKF